MTVEELLSRIGDGNSGARDIHISDLEKSVQAMLPDDYRAFLTARNGGSLAEQLEARFQSNLYQGEYGNVIVDRIFSVGGCGETSVKPVKKHLAEIEQAPGGVPDQMICIADDYSGNVITLDLRSGTHGQVGLIDHELIGDTFDDPEGYQVVASSFSAFVRTIGEPADSQALDAKHHPERAPFRWSANNNEGLWVMLAGLAVALIALAWLGELS